ncbi:hypothetical protein IQ264_18415 [Phormidium sp. LEGE 05292]|uniref:hypothetical protein n=1 Tax=[Phormidium] sp. LEGE 05292 TaxID=767427 RepID=UPI001882E082|nr:hypothetical protein [Phormidium sp. LEGE 05292]MBE9227405.1 hypothetical protein [Phormidium sp. LEGE 05292]
MNNPLVRIVLFALLLLFLVYPFGALSGIMLLLIGAAFLWTVWGIVEAIAGTTSDDRS